MNNNCSFLKITGGRCGSDTKDRSRSVDCVPLLSCNRDISAHKSARALIDVENEMDLILSRASMFSTPVNRHKSIGDMSCTSWSARYRLETFSQ